MPQTLSTEIKKWALQNAILHNGKASLDAVIGKLIASNPALKKRIPELRKKAINIIEKINKLEIKEQSAKLKRIAPELLAEQKKPAKELEPLPKAKKGNVVMRFAPSPSGPLHIGHAIVLALNLEYCKNYAGKLILRIEDTDPKKIYEPAYKMIKEDAQWLTGNSISATIIQSDRLGYYYDYAELLISKGHAYVCTCNPDIFKELLAKGVACPCRELPAKEHLKRWDKMFGEYKPGQAVVRIKTDIKHPNPAMRDWPALRINDHIHPRTGTDIRVWPLMNFSVAIDDHLLGITHTIRGKDHMDNEKRQAYIFRYMGWQAPMHLYIGRINFAGLELSCTKTKQAIERGEFEDWDDIRLPFLAALRRRGYQPGAFIKYAKQLGLSLADKTVTKEEFFKALDAFNRELIEPLANRYFFVEAPIEINIVNAPEQEVKLKLHPDYPRRGHRRFKTSRSFYISKNDFDTLKEGELYRLMDCLNFKLKDKRFIFDSVEYELYKKKGKAIMHWLPKTTNLVKVEVKMPDGSIKSGLGEPMLRNLKEGSIIQFERFAFCRLDKKSNEKLLFWYTHR